MEQKKIALAGKWCYHEKEPGMAPITKNGVQIDNGG